MGGSCHRGDSVSFERRWISHCTPRLPMLPYASGRMRWSTSTGKNLGGNLWDGERWIGDEGHPGGVFACISWPGVGRFSVAGSWFSVLSGTGS